VPMGMSAAGQNPFGTGFTERYAGQRPNQGIGAEMIVDRWGLSRAQLDEFSLGSHAKAAAAQDEGRFAAEITAVTGPDGTNTAGNSSQISDGAAALLIMTSEKAAELGLTPIVRIHTAVVVGDDP